MKTAAAAKRPKAHRWRLFNRFLMLIVARRRAVEVIE